MPPEWGAEKFSVSMVYYFICMYNHDGFHTGDQSVASARLVEMSYAF